MHQPQEPAAPKNDRVRRGVRAGVYTGVVLIAVALVLLARGFSQPVGDAQIAGRFALLPFLQSRVPEELALTWNGLTLHFARTMKPALVGFESAGTGTDLVFDGGGRLRVTPGADTGGSITLAPAGADAAAGSVVVPFSIEGAPQYPPPAGAALEWKRAGHTYLLTLPSGGSSDPEAQTLTLPLLGPAAAVLQVQGVAPEARAVTAGAVAAAAAPTRLPRESDMPTVEKLRAVVSAWKDAAWQGWSSTRYSGADGSWRFPDGTRRFSEAIGVGLLSESVARGQWQKMFALWSDALSAQQGRAAPPARDFTTSAYVGGVKDFAAAFRTSSESAVATASAALSRDDASVLLVPGLVPLLLDHGSPDLVQAAGQFLVGKTAAGADLAGSLALAADLLDYLALVRADEAMQRLLSQTVESRILSAVRTTDAGVFLETAGGSSDVRADIAGGALLLRAGPVLDSTLASAVGRGLLASTLALSDDSGFLPAALTLSGGTISAREGSLAPEAVYSLLPVAEFVPRETPLRTQIGTGAWVWTSARLATATGSSAGAALVFAYPRGVPYHLVLTGLPPFGLLKLHGIPWHSDPTYFKYSDGWSYDSASRTLFMKITGRLDREEIDITY